MLDGMDPSDPDSFHRADTRFHIEIVRLAKNAILTEVFERSHELFFRMPAYWRVFGLPRGKAPTAHGVKWIHYRRIFSALRRRDGGEARDQTRWALRNISAILEAAGSSLDRVVKVTVYMKDGVDPAAVNEEYRTHFAEPLPARSSVFVSRLKSPEMLIEIEAVATVG